MELLFCKPDAFLCNIKYWSQTYWTILTLLMPKKYAAIISGSLNGRACLSWCTVKILPFSSFPSSRSKTLPLLLRRKTTSWYILLTKHMVQDIGQRTLLHADWSFSCPWFIVISAQEYQKRNCGLSDTSFNQWKLSLRNLSEFLFPSRLDCLRYFAGGICILLAKVNKFCWFGRIFVLYYCIESNITMQPTPSFARSILTII